jgi:predicted pyridoxine 5'-phosphate oxidase superfamily flavin-nucleotide-binding protein
MKISPDNQHVSSFHEGEQAVQARVGVADRMFAVGKHALRGFMPDQHREFFAQLPFVIIGAAGEQQPWASILTNAPGFIESPDPRRLCINARFGAADPLAGALSAGQPVGLLGIEPHTRRRNRVNGILTEVQPERMCIEVSQSFGNCPKYIQARKASFIAGRERATAPRSIRTNQLDAVSRRIVAGADTFYIASMHPDSARAADPARGVDVSHRGGKPGFVRVDDDGHLSVPDFAGNFFFNTLGNLLLNPHAGLLFIDFDNGDVVHLAADAQIVWDGQEVEAFAGAQRLLRFSITAHLRIEGALPLRWSAAQISPFLQQTGNW